MMKIIYIVNARIPTEKAHGFQISKTCEKFSDSGINTELWVPARKNSIKENLFDYYGIKRNFIVKRIPCIDIIFLSKYFGPLVFHVQTLFFVLRIFFKKISKDTIIYSRDFFIVILLNLKGFNTVYNAHNWSNRRGLFLKLFLNKKTKIVCNSKGTKKEFCERGFKNSVVVSNGVDLEKFDIILNNKQELREKLNLPKNKKIVLYLGNLYPWKGIDIVVEVAKKNNNENIFFVVVGGTGNGLIKYRNIIIDNQLSNILFVGHKKQEDTPLYLKASNVLLLPNIPISEESEKFTSPIKMFEYMASGVSVVASDLPSIREVLNEENSVLIKAGSADSLLSGINKVLLDNNLAKNISDKAKEDVKKYTWDEYIKKILNFIINKYE